jgi:hypothetical protein
VKVNTFNLFINREYEDINEVKAPMILISEVQRSGGTLLSQLFDGHHNCLVHPSEIMINHSKYIWPNIDMNNSCDIVFKLLKLKEEHMIHKFLINRYSKLSAGRGEKIKTLPFCFDKKKFNYFFSMLCSSSKPSTQREALNKYFSAYFFSWIDYQNLYTKKKYVVGFTPRVNMMPNNVDLFFRDYNDGFLISLIRDPRDWYASAKLHSLEYDSIDKSLDLWQLSVEQSIKNKEKYGSKVILINFESLLVNLDKTMKKLCTLIDLPFSNTLLNPTFNTMPIASVSSHRSSTGVNQDAIGRYKKKLSKNEITHIENRVIDIYESSKKYCL